MLITRAYTAAFHGKLPDVDSGRAPQIAALTVQGQQWLPAVVALFAALLAAALVARQIGILVRRNEFDVLRAAHERMTAHFDTPCSEDGAERERQFFALHRRFADENGGGTAPLGGWGERAYRESLVKRVAVVATLTNREREADLRRARPVVEALTDVATLLDYGFVRPHKLLSTYHLQIARAAFIAEPYVLYETLRGGRGRWGMRVLALGEVARRYNDLNPLHRAPILLLDETRSEPPAVALYPRTPKNPLIRTRLAVRRIIGYPGIGERTKRRQQRRLTWMDQAVTRCLKESSATTPAVTGAAGPTGRADGPPNDAGTGSPREDSRPVRKSRGLFGRFQGGVTGPGTNARIVCFVALLGLVAISNRSKSSQLVLDDERDRNAGGD